jgi:MFS family permease
MSTYRGLFRTPQFTPLFVVASVNVAATTISGLALGTLVFTATGSPLLSALSMFGASFAQLLGAFTVLSAADRLPPRLALVAIALAFAVGTFVLAAPGLPVLGVLLVVLGTGLVNTVHGGVRWGLLGEILPPGDYLLGRSVFNMAVGIMQITGFALGGALVAVLSPRPTLVAAGLLYVLAAVVARFGLTARPARSAGRPSIRETWRVNAHLWRSPGRRATYVAMWLPNGLIVGCEALFVAYTPASAGVLFVAAALGMLTGDLLAGRFVPANWRPRLITPFQVLLALPFLAFVLRPPTAVAVALVAIGAIGYGGSLLLQDRLLAQTSDSVRGQALGLHSSGLLAGQALGATFAGAVAQHLAVGTAMTVMAVLSLTVSAVLLRPLNKPALPAPHPLEPQPA